LFKKYTFTFLLLSCLALFNIFITSPQPAQASIIGEPCSVHWVDKSVSGWPFVINTWLPSCPIECPFDIAGDYNNPSDLWCEDFTPPPNHPGVIIGNACSGSTSRTVILDTAGTNGTSFDILVNGQTVSGATYTFTNLPEGLFTAQGQAHNSKGSSGWSYPVASGEQDYSPPTTTANMVGITGENGWYISPVTVSFTANDAGCLGVSQTAYAVNGTPGNYLGTPFVVSNEGANNLQYLSTDGANTETQKSVVFGIDTVQPDIFLVPDSPANSSGWYNAPVSVAVIADDTTSGIDTVQKDVNGAGLTTYSTPVLFDTDGVHTIDAQVTDNAGNLNYDGIVIQLDSIAPTLVPSVVGTQNGTTWYTSAPTMSLTATDVTSGVAGLGYSVNGGDLNLYLSPVIFNQDGVYNIQLIALDNAQNSTTQSIQIQFDSTAPDFRVDLVGDKGENGWFISQPIFVVTANDTTSQVGSIGYNIENGGWNSYTAPVKITREGLYSISVQVSDNATNTTAHTFQLGYDITPPQTSATLTEIEGGMVVTLNRWDGVSGYALTRMAINGVWQDYHHPVTITGVGEYWVQYFTTDFAGNIEAEKITSFTIAETGVVITQNPPVVNINPPANPPNTPPFETDDDFPPNVGDETIFYVSPPPPPVIISTPPTFSDDNRTSNNGEGQHTTNTNTTTLSDNPRISRPPFIREDTETTRLSDVFPLEAHIPPAGNPPRLSRLPVIREEIHELGNITPDSHQTGNTSDKIRRTPTIIREGDFALESHPPRVRTNPVPLEYVEHPVAFVPTESAIISDPTTGATIPENAPLDVTMLAMLGLTMAGAGVMKSESARKKQDELAKQDAIAQANLVAVLAEQKDSAEENWAENQVMQENAQQSVMTEVTQSEANRQFWADYAIWEQKVAEAEAKRQAEQQTANTGGMFPPGSTVEDLPPHLQKLFWELGNMHFEKDENGDWRFADDRGELGYFQYLIREALREGDSDKLTQHFQDANKYIDKTLLNWSDTELEEVRDSAVSLVTQKQNNIPNGKGSDKRIELMVETNKGVVDVNHAIQQKSLEIKQDFVERERQHLTTFVDTQVTEHQNIAHQTITTNMSQVAVRLQPPVTSGVGGGGGVMPLHISTPILTNIINTIPLTLSVEDLPVPPPPDTGNLIVMAGTTEAEIDAILATQYTHYLDTNYDVELMTDGNVDWSATETYDAFLATETTAQALYYQAIQSGLLDLGMSRFDLSTLSPEQVFKNAIGHVEIQKVEKSWQLDPLHTQWDADNDDSTIFYQSGLGALIPDSLQWAITREFGQVLDHRSFNYGTSELQRNGIAHQEQIASGFTGDTWNRSSAGMVDMSHVGGPVGMTNSSNFTVDGIDANAQDEWADMFAHWVNFTNFRMTQPYDLSEKELQERFITDYLEIPPLENIDLSTLSTEQLNLLSINLEKGLNPNSGLVFNENESVPESLRPYLERAIENQRYTYNEVVDVKLPTYFDRMANMDNWVSGSLFTANLWREPSFQENLKDEILAIKQLDTIPNSPIRHNFENFGQIDTFATLRQQGELNNPFHSDVFDTFDDYATGINGINNLSPSGLRELYQDQRQLMLRILTATMGNEDIVGLDTGTYGNYNLFASDAEIASTIPYAVHSLTNTDLLNLIEVAKTFSPSLSTSETYHPAYQSLVDLFTASPDLSQENSRDAIGQPIPGAPQATTPSHDWLAEALLFTGALLFEPIDWAISGVEAVGHLANGDFGSALGVATLALLPTALFTIPSVRRQIAPMIKGFYETGQQGVHDLYRIIRESPTTATQFMKQVNDDVDWFFDAYNNPQRLTTNDWTQAVDDWNQVDNGPTYFADNGDNLGGSARGRGVTIGQTGSYKDLRYLSSGGDALDIHHMPQKGQFMSIDEGGCIVLPVEVHRLTRSWGTSGRILNQQEANLSFSVRLQRDIDDLRQIAKNLYDDATYFDESIKGLIQYYKENYPDMIDDSVH